MTTGSGGLPITRIFVEFGPIADGDELIDTACELASAVHAELCGLLVEDEALHDLSGLPFAHALLPGRAQAQAFDPDLLRQAYERRAVSYRRRLSAQAGSTRLNWNLDTARGHGSAEFHARISRTDLVVVKQHTLGQSTRELIDLGRSAAGAASGVVLIGRRTRRDNGPVVAIDDGDEAGAETVALAARLAHGLGAQVALFVIADDDATARRTEARDLALLGTVPAAAVRRFASKPLDALEDALARAAPRFVVADLDGAPFRDNESAVRLVRAARAPILLLKPDPRA